MHALLMGHFLPAMYVCVVCLTVSGMPAGHPRGGAVVGVGVPAPWQRP